METRIAVMSSIMENGNCVQKANALLHKYSDCIIGRMGTPCRRRRLSNIRIALDAPPNTISPLSGASVKTAYSFQCDLP